jgi:hypothetical protein
MLERMRADESAPASKVSVGFRFAYTNAWHVFRQKAALEPTSPVPEPELDVSSSIVPDEPSLSNGNAWAERLLRCPREFADGIWIEALERALALVLADDDDRVDAATLNVESEAFRRLRDLLSDEQLQIWMRENELDVEAFSSLIYQEVLVARHRAMARRLGTMQLANVLRSRSAYHRLNEDPT